MTKRFLGAGWWKTLGCGSWRGSHRFQRRKAKMGVAGARKKVVFYCTGFFSTPSTLLGTYHKIYATYVEWVHTTHKHQNDLPSCVQHACTGTKTDQYFQEHGKINRSLGPHRRFQLATVYLLDGRGHHRVPISSTLKVLITPPYPYRPTWSIPRAPSCSAPPN